MITLYHSLNVSAGEKFHFADDIYCMGLIFGVLAGLSIEKTTISDNLSEFEDEIGQHGAAALVKETSAEAARKILSRRRAALVQVESEFPVLSEIAFGCLYLLYERRLTSSNLVFRLEELRKEHSWPSDGGLTDELLYECIKNKAKQ
jgi:hypothetical protein